MGSRHGDPVLDRIAALVQAASVIQEIEGSELVGQEQLAGPRLPLFDPLAHAADPDPLPAPVGGEHWDPVALQAVNTLLRARGAEVAGEVLVEELRGDRCRLGEGMRSLHLPIRRGLKSPADDGHGPLAADAREARQHVVHGLLDGLAGAPPGAAVQLE